MTAPPNPIHNDTRAVAAASSETAAPTTAGSRADRRRDVAVVLDLAGDRGAALRWAEIHLCASEIQWVEKSELKWESKRAALRSVRAIGPETFAVHVADLEMQSARGTISVFGALAGARRILFGDRSGRIVRRSRLRALLIDAPRVAVEILLGYSVIVPLSWLMTLALGAAATLQDATPRMNRPRVGVNANGASAETSNGDSFAASPRLRVSVSPRPLTALYVRATLSPATEGGMATHVAGLIDGAAALGHHVKLIASGRAGLSGADLVTPSTAFSATRALFELWNNLVFTLKSLSFCAHRTRSTGNFDFIYQRYSRFNWTGVVLKLATGRPLALEYNGSEVWVSRRWDPVGQRRLLARFERLNLRAADLIFVVSEVERRNLIAAGIDGSKIIVNPNGVDPERFRPGCGGPQIRRALNVESTIVVGFLGTFGPWHGAPVLAEAAARVSDASRFHFLFIGEGDERATTESIINNAGKHDSASFVGRIAHDEAPAYLDACDILVSPHVPAPDGSEFFGSPTKLFEYMSMAKPIVASRLGQIAEVIADGENGVLVEPGDADALARTIEKLASDEALRARLGAAARETVIEQYTWRHNAARVFEAIRRFTERMSR